jgi:hypothetical protein
VNVVDVQKVAALRIILYEVPTAQSSYTDGADVLNIDATEGRGVFVGVLVGVLVGVAVGVAVGVGFKGVLVGVLVGVGVNGVFVGVFVGVAGTLFVGVGVGVGQA